MQATDEGRLAPGSLVDHFRVLRFIGRGGMGEVYLARDTRLGRKVALKMVRADAFEDPQARERFLEEARLTARFNHPHIVTLYDVGEHEESPYVALEFLEGQTLRGRMDEEELGQREALRLGLAVAEAMVEAHAHGVLHRDLKPQNVQLPPDGRLRVLDFGLAKTVRADVEAPLGQAAPGEAGEDPAPQESDLEQTLEQSGEVLAHSSALAQTLPLSDSADATLPDGSASTRGVWKGTPAYMAPEQWRQEPCTEATDVWALGVVLYEMLSGRRPYPQQQPITLAFLVVDAEPVPVLDTETPLPPDGVALVMACLDKSPALRPSAREVAEGLAGLLSQRRPTRVENPFRGLLPFGERHADLFFGRDEEIAAFLEQLRELPVCPVVGPSGAGKSSFVRAGVIPRLREQRKWVVLGLRPGRSPFEALASRLGAGETSARTYSSTSGAKLTPATATEDLTEPEHDLARELREQPSRLALHLLDVADREQAHVLLFVDQLEELYTLGEQGADGLEGRLRFMEAICAAADDPSGPVRVVFTLRDDFLGRLAETPASREALGRVTVLRTPGAAVLTEVLVRPVRQRGYRWEDDELPQEMARALGSERSALPLLQFAGRVLWERRDPERRLITREAHDAMGGVEGALAQHTDRVIGGLSRDQVLVAREILLRLVTPHATRQMLPRRRLLENLGPQAEPVLERLTRERVILVWKGRLEAELELVHESLITTWEQLARWLDETREERSFLAEVHQAATLWDQRGRLQEEVWHGEALASARQRARRCKQVGRLVSEFLEAGETSRRKRARWRRAIWAITACGLVSVSVIFAVLASTARQERGRAEGQRREAISQRREAVHQKQRAQLRHAAALREGARSAVSREAWLEARAKLRSALEAGDDTGARLLWQQLRGEPRRWQRSLGALVYDAAFTPDGKTLAVAAANHSIQLFAVDTSARRVLRGHRDQVFAVAISPDGRWLASGSWGGEVRLWDLRTGKTHRVLRGHSDGVWSVAFSPDGRQLASAGDDRTIRLWSLPSGRLVRVLRGHLAGIWVVRFGPSGRFVASGADDRTLRLWATQDGRQVRVLRGHTGGVQSVALSADGKHIVSGSGDHTVRIWNRLSGKTTTVLRGHQGPVRRVIIDERNQRLLTGSTDRTVRLWSFPGGTPQTTLQRHSATLKALALGPQGRLAASGGSDKAIRLWRISSAAARKRDVSHTGPVYSVRFDAKGERLASGGGDHTIRLWSVSRAVVTSTLRGHQRNVRDVMFLPDGERLASAGDEKMIRIWSLADGRVRRVLRGHRAAIRALALSADTTRLLSGSRDMTLRIWDARPGGKAKALRVLRGHSGGVYDVAFGPRARTAISASWDKTARLWDLGAGRSLATLPHQHQAVIGARLLPRPKDPRRQAVTASLDGLVRLWHLAPGTKPRIAQKLGPLPGRAYYLDVHPDGLRVGIPCSDGHGRIWHTPSSRVVQLSGHRGEINALRFSPQGDRVATAGDDGTVRLWDGATGRPIWRTILLRDQEVYTHLGCRRLDGSPCPKAHARWKSALLSGTRTAAESVAGRHLCAVTETNTLNVWDMAGDRLIARRRLRSAARVTALPGGCLTWEAGRLRLHTLHRAAPSGKRLRTKELATDVVAYTQHAEGLWVATKSNIIRYDPQGHERARAPGVEGLSAVARIGGRLALGFTDGGIELRAAPPGGVMLPLSGTPSAPVTHLMPGPGNTLIAGFGSGHYGLWSRTNGAALRVERLHGPVTALRHTGGYLRVATELGQFTQLDLSVIGLPYCRMLRDLWRRVPVIWEGGLPKRRRPSSSHPCRRGPG